MRVLGLFGLAPEDFVNLGLVLLGQTAVEQDLVSVTLSAHLLLPILDVPLNCSGRPAGIRVGRGGHGAFG